KLRSKGHCLIKNFGRGNRGSTEVLHEHEVVKIEQFFQLFLESGGIVEVLNPQRTAADLVFIGGANTATGGADFAFALTRLARLVHSDMVRQDQRTRDRYAQA